MSRNAKNADQRRPSGDTRWQAGGYHMEDSPCEHEVPVNAQNDRDYVPGQESEEWADDPFRDDGSDPALRSTRSSDVDGSDAPFWVGREQAPPEAVVDREGRKKNVDINDQRSLNKPIVKALLATLAVVLVLWTAAMLLIFRVRQIEVTGAYSYSPETIISLSGVRKGDNMLTLNKAEIERRVESEVGLVLLSVDMHYPGQVVINVRERTPAAYLLSNGFTYVLDSQGYVLSRNMKGESYPGLMRVEGMDIRSASVGSVIELNRTSQLTAYREVLIEVRVMGLTDQVYELYVTTPENLYIGTVDGFSVRLGNASRVHAKLRAMKLTREALLEMGYTRGTIDVSTPAEPTWIPENADS